MYYLHYSRDASKLYIVSIMIHQMFKYNINDYRCIRVKLTPTKSFESYTTEIVL